MSSFPTPVPILQFSPLHSQPTPSFWSTLTSLKLDRLKLDDTPQEIIGWLKAGNYALPKASKGHKSHTDSGSGSAGAHDQEGEQDGEGTGEEKEEGIWLPGSLMLDGSSLNSLISDESSRHPIPRDHFPIRGVLKNLNTIEEFKDAGMKKALFQELVDGITRSGNDRGGEGKGCQGEKNALNPFVLVTFADLKKYVYHYWFAFPAMVEKPAWEMIVPMKLQNATDDRDRPERGPSADSSPATTMPTATTATTTASSTLPYSTPVPNTIDESYLLNQRRDEVAFLYRANGENEGKSQGGGETGKVEDWSTFFDGVPEKEVSRPFLFFFPYILGL